jgi:serine/threonine protein kinase
MIKSGRTEHSQLQTYYKVGKILGKGGFGKVHLGLQRISRKLVAIKSIRFEKINEA